MPAWIIAVKAYQSGLKGIVTRKSTKANSNCLQETKEVFERLKRMENFETQDFDQTVSVFNLCFCQLLLS